MWNNMNNCYIGPKSGMAPLRNQPPKTTIDWRIADMSIAIVYASLNHQWVGVDFHEKEDDVENR